MLRWGKPHTGLNLRECMTFTTEPMINQGQAATRNLSDVWAVVSRNGK